MRNLWSECDFLELEYRHLFLADGQAAFQEIFHVHLHVFPRFKGDSYKIEADWGGRCLIRKRL